MKVRDFIKKIVRLLYGAISKLKGLRNSYTRTKLFVMILSSNLVNNTINSKLTPKSFPVIVINSVEIEIKRLHINLTHDYF